MMVPKRMLLPIALVMSSAVLFSHSAHAQTDDTRKEREEGKVLKMNDVDPAAAQSEEYRRLAREKRHQEMAFAKDLLAQDRMQGEAKAELMLRLADLYFEEGRDIYLTEMSDFEKKYDACFNDKTCRPETMSPDNTESRSWQAKSIKLYRLILENFPTFARADEATFYLASALQDTGDRKSALEEFTRLVKTYPESQYVPDSYVQIGEYYFDENQAYKALLAYQKATAYKDSDKWAFASYKLAWCFYNVGEYGKAIDTMKSVVAYSMVAEQAGQGSKSSNLQLQDEALKDLVRFFADAGEMDEAYDYFNKLGKKELIHSMLKRLAGTYFEQGKYEQCIQTYRRLIAEDPNSKSAPEYQNEIVQAYRKIGKKSETLEEIDRLRKTYGKSSAWARTNASNQEAIDAAMRFIEKNLRDVAIDYHTEAKKLPPGKQANETYELAYKAYSVYLLEFPNDQHTYEMRYAFGELLFKIKHYDEAFDQYMKVVEMDTKGQHSQFCAESAIFAADEMVKKERKEGKIQAADANNKTQALPLSDWETKMLAALDQYAKLFPSDTKTKNIIYKSAYLLYEKNQFKEASDRFRTVIAMDPKSREASQAANLILDSFALVEDWTNLKEVSKAFYDQQNLGDAEFKKETYNIYERASFKLIEETFKKDKDEVKAADGYMAFYAEFPKSEVADLALNNASVYYFNQKLRGKTMEARKALIDNFPKSKYYNDQVGALGFDYESIANFAEAANWYEKLFTLNKDHPSAPDAIYSAALFRRALGEPDKAIKDFQQYIAAYPTKENISSVRVEIGKIYEANQRWNEAANTYKEIFGAKDTSPYTGDQLMFARLHYGLALEKLGQQAKADAHYKETVDWYRKAATSGTTFTLGVDFVAEILFKQAEKQFQDFMALKIEGPKGKVSKKQEDQAVADNLKKKLQALGALEKTYAEIVGTGAGEWGLAALVRVGQANENMAQSLLNSHIPSYLTQDQIELYRMALEDNAYKPTEKAVTYYAAALDKSFELNLYDENTAFATRRLAELRPKDFPALDEGLLKPGYTSTAKKSASFEKSL